jgi:hypothetical protein
MGFIGTPRFCGFAAQTPCEKQAALRPRSGRRGVRRSPSRHHTFMVLSVICLIGLPLLMTTWDMDL